MIVPASLLKDFAVKKKVTPIIGSGPTHHIDREWEVYYSGELLESFTYQKDAYRFAKQEAWARHKGSNHGQNNQGR